MTIKYNQLFYLFFILLFTSCRTLTESQISAVKLYSSANKAAAQGVVETRKTINTFQNEKQALIRSTTWGYKNATSSHLDNYINTVSERDSLLILYKEAFTTLEKYSDLLLAVMDEEYGKDLPDKTEDMADHTDSIISTVNTISKKEFPIGLGFWVKKFFNLGAKKVLKRKRFTTIKMGIEEGFNPMDSIYNFYTNIAFLNDLSESNDLLTAIPSAFTALLQTIYKDSTSTPSAISIYNEVQPLYQKLQLKNKKLNVHIKNTYELIKAIQPFYKSLKESCKPDTEKSIPKELTVKLKSALRKYNLSYQNLN